VAATPHPRLTRYKVVFLKAQMLFYSMESQADASQELRVGKGRKDKTNGTDDLEDGDDFDENAFGGKEGWNSRVLMIWQGSPRRARKEALADLASACGKFDFGTTVNSKRRVKFI
jgi:hypothetical protein